MTAEYNAEDCYNLAKSKLSLVRELLEIKIPDGDDGISDDARWGAALTIDDCLDALKKIMAEYYELTGTGKGAKS